MLSYLFTMEETFIHVVNRLNFEFKYLNLKHEYGGDGYATTITTQLNTLFEPKVSPHASCNHKLSDVPFHIESRLATLGVCFFSISVGSSL